MAYEGLFDTALEKVCKVRFHYKDGMGKETYRTIQPVAMFRYKNSDDKLFTYAIGFCELDSDFRTFRLDRMSKVILVNETFPVKFFDVDSHLDRSDDDFSGFNLHRVKIIKYVQGMVPPLKPPVKGDKTYGERGTTAVKPLKTLKRDSKYPKLWESPKLLNPPCKCRSPLEEEILSALDSDSSIYGYEIEPFRISYWAGDERRFYTPDLLIRYRDNRKIIVELKLKREVGEPINQSKFKAIQQYANENGYGFEAWTDPSMIPVDWKRTVAGILDISPKQTSTVPFQQSNLGCLAFIVVAILFCLFISRTCRNDGCAVDSAWASACMSTCSRTRAWVEDSPSEAFWSAPWERLPDNGITSRLLISGWRGSVQFRWRKKFDQHLVQGLLLSIKGRMLSTIAGEIPGS